MNSDSRQPPTRRYPTGDNIYQSNNLGRAQEMIFAQARKKHAQSQRPGETGVIPELFNQLHPSNQLHSEDSVFSDASPAPRPSSRRIETMDPTLSPTQDPTSLLDRAEQFKNNSSFQQKIRQETGPSWASQFEPMRHDHAGRPTADNKVGSMTGPGGLSRQLEMERKLALQEGFSNVEEQGDQTYNVVSKENFVHHNMIPSFRPGQGYTSNPFSEARMNEQKQRRVDLFTGSLKDVQYRPKTERRPLFNPIVGLTNIYGMPNNTDYYSSRYIPSRERRNEHLPGTQKRITPGLNMGYHQDSQRGFHDLTRVLPKTIDDLRTPMRRQKTYGGVVIPGMKGHKRSSRPYVRKMRPERFRENNPNDLLKSLGYLRAPTAHGEYNAPHTNRSQKSMFWMGGGAATTDKHLPWDALPQHRRSNKENFETDGPRNVAHVGAQKGEGNTNSYQAPVTLKQLTDQNNYVPHARGLVQKGHAHNPDDVPTTTLKELTQHQNYLGGVEGLVQKGHAHNPMDLPTTTLKELHIDNNYLGQAGGLIQKGHAHNPDDIPFTTLKDLHIHQNWIGQAGGLLQKGHAQNPNDVAQTTRKEQTINNNYLGQAGGLVQKGHTQNPNDRAKTTLKEQYIQNNYLGQAGGLVQKGHTQNPDDLAKTTLKEQFIDTKYLGQAGGLVQKGHVHNPDDLAKTTLKEQYVQNNYLGQAGGFVQKGHVHNPNDVAQTTRKEQTINNNYLGNAGGLLQKGHAHNPDDVARTTRKEWHIDQNWIGGAGGLVQKGHSLNPDDRAKTTLKEQYVNTQYLGQAGGLVQKGHVHNPDDLAKRTRKEQFIQNQYLGQAGGLVQKGHAHNPEEVARTTRKEQFVNTKYLGQAGGLVQKGHAHNPEDRPELTLKDLNIEQKWVGGVDGTRVQKGHARNLEDRPEVTLKDLHIDQNWVGGADATRVQKGHARNLEDRPDVTLKDIHNAYNYVNPLHKNEAAPGSYHITQQGMDAPINLRNLVENNTYLNPAGYHEKQTNRRDALNMHQNVVKEVIAQGRAPTQSNYDKGPTMDFTMVELCNPVQMNRELYPTRYGQNVDQCLPIAHTRIGNRQLPQTGWRIDTHVADNLQHNPLVNNTQHKSVQF